MSLPEPDFTIRVDIRNPGQFFACCGVLELSHRLWSQAEGWFDTESNSFAVVTGTSDASLVQLMSAIQQCQIEGLDEAERIERDKLDAARRELKKRGEKLAPHDEQRRRELGEQARGGAVHLGEPFNLRLDWWQASDDLATPKTWAGPQEICRIARAAQDALLLLTDLRGLLDYGYVMRVSKEYLKQKSDRKKVEPFYFDARRFSHPLDTGFSLDKQGTDTVAHPAVELLCLVGLQRFRPSAESAGWGFGYRAWSFPLGAVVAASVVGGVVPTHEQSAYRFPLRSRECQERYKAFGFAIPIGG